MATQADILKKLLKNEEKEDLAILDTLIDAVNLLKEADEAIKSLLTTSKEQEGTLTQLLDKETPEANFEPIITALQALSDRTDAVKLAIEGLKATDTSKVESLLQELLNKEPEEMDMSCMESMDSSLKNASDTLQQIMAILGEEDDSKEEEKLDAIVKAIESLNESITSIYIPEIDYKELAKAVADAMPTPSGGGASKVFTKSQPYSIRMDTASTTGITYVGKAALGSLTSAAAWQIMKMDETGTPVTLVATWADGNDSFDNVWDNRTSLTYL